MRLKGHGTSPDDLAQRSADDWRESVDSAYAAMTLECKRVVLVGFSFGGGLALEVSSPQ